MKRSVPTTLLRGTMLLSKPTFKDALLSNITIELVSAAFILPMLPLPLQIASLTNTTIEVLLCIYLIRRKKSQAAREHILPTPTFNLVLFL